MRPALVIVPCGGAKLTRPAPAAQLYIGPYHRKAAAAARALRPTRGWLILSGKHGLLRPSTVIAPYEQRIGKPDAVTVEQIRRQAEAFGLLDADPVVVLAGAAYVAAARAVWPGALAPLHGGMGYQMQQMVRISQTGRIAP